MHDPVTWYTVSHAETQTRTSTARLSFVLKVPLCNYETRLWVVSLSLIVGCVQKTKKKTFRMKWLCKIISHASLLRDFTFPFFSWGLFKGTLDKLGEWQPPLFLWRMSSLIWMPIIHTVPQFHFTCLPSNNTPSSPHECNAPIVQSPVKLLSCFSHQHEALSIWYNLGSI